MTVTPFQLDHLPSTFPKEEAIRIELVEGIPTLKASQKVQTRIENLLVKQQTTLLNPEEEEELDYYEDLDDYLSLVNRTIRNLSLK
jgi:hypothetical protein